MIIREATHSDIDSIIAMGKSMHNESIYRKLDFNERKVEKLIRFILESKNTFRCVVELNGEVIGMMGGYITEHWFSGEKITCDYLLYVRPDHRGSTAASMLVEAYKKWAIETDAKLITVGVNTEINTADTARFYRIHGFIPSGINLRLEV